MRTTPGHHEDGRIVATVGSLQPEQGMRIALGSREDGRICAVLAFPSREPGRKNALGPRVDDTGRKSSRASSTTSYFEAPTTSRRDS